jgi:tetratricopeptide (TPR) repeat protein
MELREQALAIAREIGDRSAEGRQLGSLASCYADLGQTQRAMELHKQALAIAREIGDRSAEGYWLQNLSDIFTDDGQHSPAVEYALAAVTISAELQGRGWAATAAVRLREPTCLRESSLKREPQWRRRLFAIGPKTSSTCAHWEE